MTDMERKLRIALQTALRGNHPEDLVASGACGDITEATELFKLAGIEFHYRPPYRREKDWETLTGEKQQ
jgi:hypothetical protein